MLQNRILINQEVIFYKIKCILGLSVCSKDFNTDVCKLLNYSPPYVHQYPQFKLPPPFARDPLRMAPKFERIKLA